MKNKDLDEDRVRVFILSFLDDPAQRASGVKGKGFLKEHQGEYSIDRDKVLKDMIDQNLVRSEALPQGPYGIGKKFTYSYSITRAGTAYLRQREAIPEYSDLFEDTKWTEKVAGNGSMAQKLTDHVLSLPEFSGASDARRNEVAKGLEDLLVGRGMK